MTNYLKGKKPITDLSYHPESIVALEKAGGEIIDIVTGTSRTDPDLISWVEYFKDRAWPVFAERVKGPSTKVKLWVQRVAEEE